ncbi:MAG: metalloregulator ArsR/SmtB family transcription factor, partial [Kosmotogaceae bacterium]
MMDLVTIFKALSCKWRIKIIEELSKEARCSCEIEELFPIDKTTLSRHIKILVDAGLVKETRNGIRKDLSIQDDEIINVIKIARKIGKLRKDAAGYQLMEHLPAQPDGNIEAMSQIRGRASRFSLGKVRYHGMANEEGEKPLESIADSN